MKDMLLVLVGAACSTLGGLAGTWYRAKIAGKIKFDEVIAERKVAAYGKALELIRRVQSLLLHGMTEGTLAFLYENGTWFADSLILLPDTFVDNWRSIRANLESAVQKNTAKEQTHDDVKKETLADTAVTLWQFCIGLAREAEASIRSELDLPECGIKQPQDAEKA